MKRGDENSSGVEVKRDSLRRKEQEESKRSKEID